jgi:hypothetical protein
MSGFISEYTNLRLISFFAKGKFKIKRIKKVKRMARTGAEIVMEFLRPFLKINRQLAKRRVRDKLQKAVKEPDAKRPKLKIELNTEVKII